MAIYKLILADTPGAEGARGYPRLLKIEKMGRLEETWFGLRYWLTRKAGGELPTTAVSPLRALSDGTFEVAVPIPPSAKTAMVYDLTGIRLEHSRPVRIVFCLDGDRPARPVKEV